MTNGTCPIWGTAAEIADPDGRDGTHVVSSPRAGGEYFVSGTAAAMLTRWDETEKIQLTSWLIEKRRLGNPCPEISSYTLDEVKKRRPPSVHDRADMLLRYLDAKSDLLGTVIKFYELDNTKAPESANELLAWTGSRQMSEVIMLAKYCSEEGWIEHRHTKRAGSSHNTVHELKLGPPGYGRLSELDRISSASKQARVVMSAQHGIDNEGTMFIFWLALLKTLGMENLTVFTEAAFSSTPAIL